MACKHCGPALMAPPFPNRGVQDLHHYPTYAVFWGAGPKCCIGAVGHASAVVHRSWPHRAGPCVMVMVVVRNRGIGFG